MKSKFNMARTVVAMGLGAFVAGAVALGSAPAKAADKVSAEIGTSYNSHFISYGSDVWSGGGDFFGSKSTQFYWGSVTVQATDAFSINFGAWADVNDNGTTRIGGDLQEVDVWIGGSYVVGPATLGATVQKWYYSGDVEEILDLSIALDDSKWLPSFPLSPSLTWHIRMSGNGSQDEGSVMVLGISPSVKLTDTLSLGIPAGVGYFLSDDYHSGTDDGIGYTYVGASLGVPLSFIPAAYGAWTATFDLMAYFTDDKVIPNNPEENFVTGSVGVTLAF